MIIEVKYEIICEAFVPLDAIGSTSKYNELFLLLDL
jgi:hypothetical protein